MLENKKKLISVSIFLVLILVVTFFVNVNLPLNYSSAHTNHATPTEIFSLWNDTSPTIEGQIYFNSSSLTTEWSAAAVYSMFDNTEDLDSKILLQNDNTNLYIGLDLVNFQTETPVTIWGAAIYLDKDQNGIFTSTDRAIILKADPGAVVYYRSYNEETNTWIEIESSSPGTPLAGSQILMSTAFAESYFEPTSHRQYEIRIPLAILGISTGNITGIGFEAFESYDSFEEEITWPYISSTPSEMRTNAGFLGDIYIGKDTGLSNFYADYVIEENTNLKSDAIGENKGVFLGTIDVDSDGDLEIVVSSNGTDSSMDYLLAIYDFVAGEMTRIWSSWTTSHQSKIFQIKGITAFDFNGDNEEELYVCGEDSRLLRFSNWNDVTKDFDESKYVFIHSPGLMG
ncbi:MAG: VCBS repeat-containing protein, partial [Asgard group archaeon]|nr:VCBS repeat-containing protein [Asgard group archaeon]